MSPAIFLSFIKKDKPKLDLSSPAGEQLSTLDLNPPAAKRKEGGIAKQPPKILFFQKSD